MRVLIGPMFSETSQQLMEGRLKWAPPGKVSTNIVDIVDDWSQVLEKIATGVERPDEKYDVLIAEFRLPDSPSFAEIYAIDPGFSVIDVDLVQGTSNTPMFDVGSATLCRLAEWLTRETGLKSMGGAPGAIAAADDEEAGEEEEESPESGEGAGPEPSEDAAAPAERRPPRLREVHGGARTPADPDSQLADLSRWLNLKLSLMMARAESRGQGQDIPGWTMSAARGRSLLDPDFAWLSREELQAQWEAADAALEAHVALAGQGRADGSAGWIAHAFGLDRIEREMLWIALAPDMSGSFAQVIGFLNDDLSQRRPSFFLLSQMIDGAGPTWELQRRLSGDSPLAGFRMASLVRTDPLIPSSLAPIVAAPDLVAMLLGRSPADVVEDANLFEPAKFGEETFDLQIAPVLRAARAAVDPTRVSPLVHFHAPAVDAGWLAVQLASVGEPTLLGDLGPLAEADLFEVRERLLAFCRLARASDAILVVAGLDGHDAERRAALGELLATRLAPKLKLVAVQGMRTAPDAFRNAAGGVMEISRPRPTRDERAWIWTRAAAARGRPMSGEEARDLAATFAFDRKQAETAVALAIGSGDVEPSEANDAALRDAARVVSRASAPPSVRRIETGLGWDDLILPEPIKADLRSIAVQVKHGTTVWEDWGFGALMPYGQATIALLAGPSGTGKTMAAQIIAGELGAALFQVDLAKTVSKYIGETEKALDRIFEAAEAASAVLLFDEADALFGKRSDIHDAHDRYANIEVNFLLQRIEEHLAPVLLTTNRKANIDSAFLRRLNKVVDFPMPDEAQRELIWTRLLPADAEVAEDVDLTKFRQLPLSGGGIANTVLAAAFMGAKDGGVIRMRHLIAAARGELAKAGMQSAGRTLTHLVDDARASGAEP